MLGSYELFVHDILRAGAFRQQNFLQLACTLGTPELLKPFALAGYDFSVKKFRLVSSRSSYVSTAAQARNVQTLELLFSTGCALCGDELIYGLAEISLSTVSETIRRKHCGQNYRSILGTTVLRVVQNGLQARIPRISDELHSAGKALLVRS